MSTVLTKPVLLDETGQAIVGKLDEIKDAIDNGGTEKYPVLIHITSMPTKTNYIAGEQLNLAGMVVKAVFSNNVEYDVTDQCTFSPANGTVLTSSDTSVTATYTWHPTGTSFTATQAITVLSITDIEVVTPPTKTSYILNEALDLSGMVVSANYDNGTSADITSECVFTPANGATLDDDTLTDVTISYTDPIGNTYTTTQSIEVIIPIYGVEWDGTAASLFTRTDMAANFEDPVAALNNGNGSSPFDTIMPWAGIERVEDETLGTLVKIPKFYFKWTTTGNVIKLQISAQQLEGFYTSPAHSDRGDGNGERDFVYVGAYLYGRNASNQKASQTGLAPKQKDIQTAITELEGLGGYAFDFAMWWTIKMLYLVEYANWDCNETIGIGYPAETGGNYNVQGDTDGMIYHTGTTASSRNTQGMVRYRYIENLWGYDKYWIAGIRYYDSNVLHIQNNPQKFSNTYASEFIATTGKCVTTGYIKSYVFWPVDSISYKYIPIVWSVTSSSSSSAKSYVRQLNTGQGSSSVTYLSGGGNVYRLADGCGLFYEDNSGTSSTQHATRIMKL